MGVKRAVETAVKALEENQKSGLQRTVYTLGPLIHNPTVLHELEQKGLQILDHKDISQLPDNSVVIIRAHGTTPEVMSELMDRGVEIIDCTCPKVLLSQKRAMQSTLEGNNLIIAGDRNHGEVIGIEGHAVFACTVIQNASEAEQITLKENNVLIAQTTFSPSEFAKITQILESKKTSSQTITVYNSICSATQERQKALDELDGKVEGIVVIGGKNSANTRRLYEKACFFCPKVVLIEDESELPEEFCSLKSVGITAGASTPDVTIRHVEEKLLGK